jgi:hypothetical protein
VYTRQCNGVLEEELMSKRKAVEAEAVDSRATWPILDVLPVIGVTALYDKFLDTVEFRLTANANFVMAITCSQMQKILDGARSKREAPNDRTSSANKDTSSEHP